MYMYMYMYMYVYIYIYIYIHTYTSVAAVQSSRLRTTWKLLGFRRSHMQCITI